MRFATKPMVATLAGVLWCQGWDLQAADSPAVRAEAVQKPKTNAQGSAHWAFQPVREPAVPEVKNRDWARNPIDCFILSRLEQEGLAPSPPADRRTLIRRATFDLLGLPPTPEEVAAFVRDRSPAAFERVVEQLLASPRYGERWGRHWLDVARYADTAGDSSDYPIPQAFLYRNYIIQSFNADKPYDLFVREQIAGDLMPAENEAQKAERIVATGFIALSRRFSVAPEHAHHLTIEDTIDTLGRSILGLTLSCARCHDHKHDPVPTQDYYGLYGIFSSTRYPYAGSETKQEQKDLVPLMPQNEIDSQLKAYRAALAAAEEEVTQLETRLKAALEAARGADGENPPSAGASPAGPGPRELNNQWIAAKKKHEELLDNPPPVRLAFAVAEGKPANAKVQLRGEPSQTGETVPRHFLTVLGGQPLPAEEAGSGRMQLAQWLTAPANPLTARVMVNRIWQHHFGRGLVGTSSDFGTHGRAPTHAELLDWLAARFVASGWSAKAMHRLIMLSAAYQQSSGDAPLQHPEAPTLSRSDALTLDPDNELLWRFNRRRLDAESIRDSLLAISGELELGPGGPHPFPPEPKWDFTQHKQFQADYETHRRSVYLMTQRIKKHPFLALFDGADPNVSTAERLQTITPLQALFAMNNPFVHEQAEGFAVRLLTERRSVRGRIERAYQIAYGRPPRPDERREGQAYLRRARANLRATYADGDEREFVAWASYARALLGSNEFLFVD
jgi:hypothetical protein